MGDDDGGRSDVTAGREQGRTAATAAVAVLLAAVGLAACGGKATSEREPVAVRGGTLRVDASVPLPIDPAFNYPSGLQEATQLTLVGLPYAPAAPVPVAEAAALPAVSADGLTYRFRIRPGFRFSDGKPVTARHFAYALNRLLRPKLDAYPSRWLTEVVGAEAVSKGRAAAATGIVAQGRTLTIRLRKPVPDLAAKLAQPYFGAVPLGLPAIAGGVQRAPLHSAGPYYVRSFDPGKRAVLARNPFWRPSLLPRRAANADRIVVNFGVSFEASVGRIERGDSDLVMFVPTTRFRQLAGRYGVNRGRFFQRTRPGTFWLAFNHERPLFGNNARLRRAVNLALDRKHLNRAADMPIPAPTDQILPPGFPGFRDHRLYPLDGPRLAEARSLAKGALRGGTATMWFIEEDRAFAEIVRYDLRRIGLDVRLELLSSSVFLDRLEFPGQRWDLTLWGWFADFPDPANFLGEAIGGPGGFNDPRFRRAVERASRLSGEARYRAFAQLDLQVMRDEAPVAPFLTVVSTPFVSANVGCVEFGWDGFPRWEAICKR